MQAFLALLQDNVAAAPGFMVFLSGAGVAAWSWWSKQKNQTTGDNAFSAVSGGYKYLSDSQQARITQQDKLITELEAQLNAAQIEIIRLRDVMESLRAVKSINDAATLRALSGDGG